MNSDVKSIIEPRLYEALIELAKQDAIVAMAITKGDTQENFINALIATIICMSDRELQNAEKINELLKANPKLQEILHDNSLLRDPKDSKL